MRILILADVCNPEWPSLPIVGYNIARALSKKVDVVVVTHIRNKENIEKSDLGKAEVVYLDTEWIAAPLYKLALKLRGGDDLGWTIQMATDYPAYLAFEWMAWRMFGQRLRAGEFDVVHRITPMSPTLPSFMAARCPVPFVLGPLNGNLPWPKEFMTEQAREKEWLSNFRNVYKFLPFYRSTYGSATKILAAFDHTIQDLPAQAMSRVVNFAEVGIDPDRFKLPSTEKWSQDSERKLTILYAGRLVPYKLPGVIVKAFAASPALRQHKLLIVGEGPERASLEQLIETHNLQNCVELAGRVSQAEVGKIMGEADIFAFPSIRELGAGVIVEAMACGLPCVVVDYGAPGTLVDSDRGVKVPMASAEILVQSFSRELENLVANPARVRQLGENARAYSLKEYAWDSRAAKIVDIYRAVTQSKVLDGAEANLTLSKGLVPDLD